MQPWLAEQAPAGHRSIAIGHAHIDTAWLWPIRETRRKCVRTFASATALMDDYPEYRFAASSAQHYAWIEESHPALFDRITERVRCGQWVPVGGMWVEADMNLPSGESLVRQMVFGQRYFEEKFGQRCEEVWIPDVFGYPAGLPQVFAAAGMRRFVTQKLSWNKQNRFPHNTFWWEGLDGTRVLTHFPPVDTYNAEITPAEVAYSAGNFKDHGWSGVSLMPFGHGDGGGGPTREMLERARRLSSADARVTVAVGTPDEFFDAVEAEVRAGAPVPVWRGELYFETHRGTLTSQLRTKLGNRRCERLLVEAELWRGDSRPVAADVDDLWREVLTQQFHDILPGSSIAWVHADAEAVFARVAADLEARIAGMLAEIAPQAPVARQPGRRAGRRRGGARGDPRHRRRPTLDRRQLGGRRHGPGARRRSVRGAADRRPGRVHRLVDDQLAPRRPLGPRRQPLFDHRSRPGPGTASRGTLGAVLELAPDHPVEYDAWDLEAWTVDQGVALTDVHDVTVEVDRYGTARRAGRRAADVRAVVEHRSPTNWRRAARRSSSTSSSTGSTTNICCRWPSRSTCGPTIARCDVQFGAVARPTHPSNPWDAAKFEVCAHRFVDVAEPAFGVAILNDGRYGHCVFDGAVRVSLARAAKYPDPSADHGRHRVTLAVLPHGGDPALVRAAASRLNSPVRVIGVGDEGGATGPGNGARRSPVVSVLGQSSGARRGCRSTRSSRPTTARAISWSASTRRSGTGRRSMCGPIGGWSRRGSATCSRSRPGPRRSATATWP